MHILAMRKTKTTVVKTTTVGSNIIICKKLYDMKVKGRIDSKRLKGDIFLLKIFQPKERLIIKAAWHYQAKSKFRI